MDAGRILCDMFLRPHSITHFSRAQPSLLCMPRNQTLLPSSKPYGISFQPCQIRLRTQLLTVIRSMCTKRKTFGDNYTTKGNANRTIHRLWITVGVAVEDADAAHRDIHPKGRRVMATALPNAGAVLPFAALRSLKKIRSRWSKIFKADWNAINRDI